MGGYFLGIDVGTSRTVVAVARTGSGEPAGEVETVGLEDGGGVASVLHLGEDGMLSVGADAERFAASEPDRVVRGFPGRIGDGEPMLLAGEPWAPEELTAWLVRWAVDRVAEREGGPAAAVAVTHPASWDPGRSALLAAAVAEQDLDVTFLAPAPSEGGGAVADPERAAPDTTARATAEALRAAGAVAPPAPEIAADEPGADGPAASGGWEVPAPRSDDSAAGPDDGPEDGAGGPEDRQPDGGNDVPAPRGPEVTSHPGDPATTNLVAGLVGFTGGMGAMNTAGLLSGYTPPHGTPAAWSGGHAAAGGQGGTATHTSTATGSGIALPAQRAGSGRWHAVAPDDVEEEFSEPDDVLPPPPLRARNNPAVLVSVGGLAAAVAVVGTLFLWPAPRTTNSATSRDVPVLPAVTAPSDAPAATLTVTPTAEPPPTHRPRPAAPRTRRPVVPVPETLPPTESTAPPSDGPVSTELTEPATTEPPSDGTKAPSTDDKDD